MLGRTPAASIVLPKARLVYWLPRSAWLDAVAVS